MSNSDPIEPTRVWTEQEWIEQHPWTSMPKGELRDFFKQIEFLRAYGGGPKKFREIYENYGSPTGRFKVRHPPMRGKGSLFDGEA